MRNWIRAAIALVAVGLWLGLSQGALAQKKTKRVQSQDRDQTNQKSEKIDDRTFARKAAEGGMAEVELGRLGEKNAKRTAVRDFARRMVADHSRANRQLLALVQRKGITIPTRTDNKHRAAVEKLSRMTGSKFDRAFMKQMVKDHVKTVHLFKAQAKHGRDPELKAFASQTLPILREHLAMAKRIAKNHKKTSTSR
jgi:putative membrane protein